MGLSGPRPAARSSCGRKSPQGSRAAVVTVYLAANTTRSLDVFDQEEPPSAAVWGPSTRLGAKSAFVEFVDGGAVFCSGSTGPPLPLSARRGTSSLYAAARPPKGGYFCTVLRSTPNRSAILRTPSVRPGKLQSGKNSPFEVWRYPRATELLRRASLPSSVLRPCRRN